MVRYLVLCFLALSLGAAAADQYTGPRPAKPDIPYLVQAGNLIETEVVQASESHPKKNQSVFTVAGASSSAKTPLAEPTFLLLSKHISPEGLLLYRFNVVNGKRQVTLGKDQNDEGPFHLEVRDLGGGLYRIEVADSLENGEYSLSPNGSNQAFCFSVVD